MRLFIALELPSEVSAHLFDLQKTLKSRFVVQTFPRSFHLTLKFLGDVSPQVVDEVKMRLSKLDFESFSARLGDLGTFNFRGSPRVVWAGVEPADVLHRLQTAVDDVLVDILPRELRFEPHLTLSRVKAVRDRSSFDLLLKGLKVKPFSFAVNRLVLVKSVLRGSAGPLHEVIFQQSFK